MIRRRFLSLLASAPVVACADPRVPEVPLPRPARDYGRCLPDHLRALSARAAEVRRGALAELTTADAVHRRQAWVRDTLWRLAGGAPDRTPLGVRTRGVIERAGYRVEKLVYETQPGLHVPANLYLPAGQGPFPGVLFQVGHLPGGKAEEPYQRACQALVKRGIAVLVFDPAGQGERRERAPSGLPDDEHDRIGHALLLTGDTLTQLMLWDAVRSLDVLAARPEIDSRRLGALGHSGGGTLTMMLAAVDDRLTAVAISCANTENFATPDLDPPGAVDDAEQNLPGAASIGFDRWDTLYPLAPRPLLVLVSTDDCRCTYSPAYLTSGREEVERLRRVYAILGDPAHLRWVESPSPHRLSADRRQEIERWFGRFLLGEDTRAHEDADLHPEPEEAIWVVPGGDVIRALGGQTPLDRARARIAARPAKPFSPARFAAARPKPGLRATVLSSTRTTDILEVQSAPEVWIPAHLHRSPESRSVLITLHPEGPLAPHRQAICATTVRGAGALSPPRTPGASAHARSHAIEDAFAWASLILGESLLEQRITDILALVEALSNHPPLAGLPLTLAARGPLTVPALFAAALDPRIERLHLDAALTSYQTLLDTGAPCPLAAILPGILTTTDLPALAAAIAPRPILASP